MIAVVMEPPLSERVVPRLSSHLAKPHYAFAVLHAALGVIAEILGLYVLSVAGTHILSPTWRFTRWKLWMRIELVLWWLVIVLGILTYYVWYVAPRSR